MDEATMRTRVAEARVGHLATVGAGARPHVVPCCFVVQRDAVFSAVDAKPKSTVRLQRIRNLEANSAATLLVDHYDDGDWSALWWVRLDGAARVMDDGPERERALDLLAEKYPQYQATRPPGPVIAIDVDRWTAWP